jgi:hypothetical protein
LGKQQDCGDEIDNAQDGLQNRNEGINWGHLCARKRCDNSRRDGQKDDDADRYRPLPPGCRHRCDNWREILPLVLNSIVSRGLRQGGRSKTRLTNLRRLHRRRPER